MLVVLMLVNIVPPSSSADVVCPDTCWCNTLEEKIVAVCMEHNLTSVPHYFDKKTQEIILMFNTIDILPDYVFHGLQNISILILQHNKLRELREQSLDGLYNLVYLDLSHNNIVIMPSRIIQNNEKIKFFYLNHNDITITGPFLVSPSLTLLDVSFCKISFLPHDSFIGIPNLTKLKINDNFITEIEMYAFRGLKRLELLTLRNNDVTTLDFSLFQGLEELRFVDFTNNSISTIPYDIFEKNRKLRFLFLKNNSLSLPQTGPIFASDSLSHLDISFCNIHFMPIGAFKRLQNLTTLRMTGNPLNSLNTQILQPLQKLQVVLLGPESSCSEQSFRDVFEYFEENSVVYYAPPLCNETILMDTNVVYTIPPTTEESSGGYTSTKSTHIWYTSTAVQSNSSVRPICSFYTNYRLINVIIILCTFMIYR